jgi:hypothetical protein
MTVHLTRESELAKMLDKPAQWVALHRRKDHWPHIDLGRFDKRYTPQQIAQIIAMYEVTPAANKPTVELDLADGLTKRARRAS